MPIISRPKRENLSRGLDIYRDTMRPFILERLGKLPGTLEEAIRRALLPHQVEEFDRDLQRVQDLASALDVNLFPRLVRAYWRDAFSAAFKGDSRVQEHMVRIKHARNEVAHPPTRDLAVGFVREHLALIAQLLGRVGAIEEQKAVKTLALERPRPIQIAEPVAAYITPSKSRMDGQLVGSSGPHVSRRVPASKYHIYTDISTKRSRIHRAECRYYRDRKEETLGDNYWHGPYASVKAAKEAHISDLDAYWDALACAHCHS